MDIGTAGTSTKTNVKVTRTKGKRAKLAFSIDFDPRNPDSIELYDALGAMLARILSAKEATELLRQINEHRQAIAGEERMADKP